jgi:hypothetical protein
MEDYTLIHHAYILVKLAHQVIKLGLPVNLAGLMMLAHIL